MIAMVATVYLNSINDDIYHCHSRHSLTEMRIVHKKESNADTAFPNDNFLSISLQTQYHYLEARTRERSSYVCMGFMALITAMALCNRSLKSVQSESVRRVHVLFSTAGWG